MLSSVCTDVGDTVVSNMDDKLKVIRGKEKQFSELRHRQEIKCL